MLGKDAHPGSHAKNVLVLSNAVAPTDSIQGSGQIYIENGILKYRGPEGTVTTLANP